MNEWPQVSVLLITYKRLDLALRTLRGIAGNLAYPGPLHYHVADDGSGPEHVETLVAEAWKDPRTKIVTSTDVQRSGVGHSMNIGQLVCWAHSDYILWLEDDWELIRAFDLSLCVRVLAEHPNNGMVRLAHLQHQTYAMLAQGAGELWWLLDRARGDGYTFTGHASLRHKRFYDAYGPYLEDRPPGETEAEFAYRFRTATGPDIITPAWTGHWGVFGHIGGVSLADMPIGGDWDGRDTRAEKWVPR